MVPMKRMIQFGTTHKNQLHFDKNEVVQENSIIEVVTGLENPLAL